MHALCVCVCVSKCMLSVCMGIFIYLSRCLLPCGAAHSMVTVKCECVCVCVMHVGVCWRAKERSNLLLGVILWIFGGTEINYAQGGDRTTNQTKTKFGRPITSKH